jgi:hypothetical protein
MTTLRPSDFMRSLYHGPFERGVFFPCALTSAARGRPGALPCSFNDNAAVTSKSAFKFGLPSNRFKASIS